MTTVIKLVSELRGVHIHTRVFAGPKDRTMANLGSLVTNVEEWQLIGAALRLGAERMADVRCHEPLEVVFEGDDEVVAALQDRGDP